MKDVVMSKSIVLSTSRGLDANADAADDDTDEEEEPRFRPKMEELDDPILLQNNDIVVISRSCL